MNDVIRSYYRFENCWYYRERVSVLKPFKKEQLSGMQPQFETLPPMQWSKFRFGEVWCGDSLQKMRRMRADSVDLIFTSPPFPLIRKKKYGNRDEKEYIDWLLPFLTAGSRLLKTTGSLVLDLGCCWQRGKPLRSAYDIRLTLEIIDSLGLSFAQEFYWYNVSRLPAPAQWVTIEKTRVKDSINKVLWFSKSENPKASNERVLQPYSPYMEEKLSKGIKAEHARPSGHQPSKYFNNRNIGSIPGNLLSVPNNNSADPYLKYCKENGLKPHPARFPFQIPEFFIRFLTEPGDKVLDPFAGSCTTGYAAERLKRRWVCVEANPDYASTAKGHFTRIERADRYIETTLPRTGVYASNFRK